MYLLKHLREEAIRFFSEQLLPAYQEARERSGFRWDTLERRGESPNLKNIPDVSIKARVAWAFKVFGETTGDQEWIQEAEGAADELVAMQEADGRWENPYKIPVSSNEDIFTTADATRFLALMGRSGPADAGAQWLLEGEVLPQVFYQEGQKQVLTGHPLENMLRFLQANHVGTMLRALVATSYIKQAHQAAVALCALQRPCRSWWWDADHPGEIKTNYHDLTVAGLMDVANATEDLRLDAPIRAAVDYVQGMEGKLGRIHERYQEDTGRRWSYGYLGITTLAMAYRNGYLLSEHIAFLAGLLFAVMKDSPRVLRGFKRSNVESRLVVTRGLTDFMEATE